MLYIILVCKCKGHNNDKLNENTRSHCNLLYSIKASIWALFDVKKSHKLLTYTNFMGMKDYTCEILLYFFSGSFIFQHTKIPIKMYY